MPRGWLEAQGSGSSGWGLIYEYEDSLVEEVRQTFILKIQAVCRGHLARRGLKATVYSVTLVQALWRGNTGRQIAGKRRLEYEQELKDKAAAEKRAALAAREEKLRQEQLAALEAEKAAKLKVS